MSVPEPADLPESDAGRQGSNGIELPDHAIAAVRTPARSEIDMALSTTPAACSIQGTTREKNLTRDASEPRHTIAKPHKSVASTIHRPYAILAALLATCPLRSAAMVKYSIQFRAVDRVEVMPTSAAGQLVRLLRPQGILNEIGEKSPVPASRKDTPAKHSRNMQPDTCTAKKRKLAGFKASMTTNATAHAIAFPAAIPMATPQACGWPAPIEVRKITV